ncbi:MAG: hypothetical protein KatS3mg067_2088 [Thermosynechococcus sp.]|nr:MAG: hypothetical protein KatS3mg067_2088 [Thermosynechococcus sp.]
MSPVIEHLQSLNRILVKLVRRLLFQRETLRKFSGHFL